MNSINEASRQVMWNLDSVWNPIFMYGLMLVSLAITISGIISRIELWRSGQPSKENIGNWDKRVIDLFTWGTLQRGVVRERRGGVMHSLIYIGFLVLLFTTTMVFIDHDLGIRIYVGKFYLILTVLSDILGLGLLIGCLIAGYRRYIIHEGRLHSQKADSFLLISLALLVAQGFLLEGLRIHVTNDPWAIYSPVGSLVAKLFWPLSSSSAKNLHFITWWFHTITVFSVFAVFPYTKMFHIISSSANLFFKFNNRPKGTLSFVGDIQALVEKGDEFVIGTGSLKEYNWKQLLDLDACTSCGRCQAVCPAYISGKPLSPKWLILDTRNHMLALHAKNTSSTSILPNYMVELDKRLTNNFLQASGLQEEQNGGFAYVNSAFRAENALVQESVISIGNNPGSRIAGEVMQQDVFWSCTTCMACVNACPVGINHVDHIISNRRNMVLMQGEVPSEAQPTLRALENRGNPFGPAAERTKWLDGVDVKILNEGDSVDYLYWVGCVSAFDPRKQKIARSLVTLMNKANLNFGILGNSEGCSGDPARRLGEESLYQTLAKSNIEILKSIRFKVLVANCPHCFNTIKNEYPQLGNLGDGKQPEIIHHSTLLKRLVKEGRLQFVDSAPTDVTFHDPCYLGRYNDEYEAPRESLKAPKSLRIIEMEKSKSSAMCCGAGGGHFWMDQKIGERVNVLRVAEASETGASTIATACPFCMQMLEDGVKLTNKENELQVKDISELLLERMQ